MNELVRLDLRGAPVHERHPMVFDGWEGLAAGKVLQIVNDYDPRAIRYMLESEYAGKFEWECVSSGPEWVVNITKTRLPEASGEELRKKVIAGLDNVRPHLQADGGDVELVDIDEAEKVVKVRLTGACGGCPSAAMTLKSGVEVQVRKFAPEILRVEPV